MKTIVALVVAFGLAGLIGCGSGAVPRDSAVVDVTATVTGPDGKPLSKTLVVILHPAGDTLGARLEAKEDGKFTGKATPGKYFYYVKLPNSDTPPKGMPAKYTEPNDNTIEVSVGRPYEIKLN